METLLNVKLNMLNSQLGWKAIFTLPLIQTRIPKSCMKINFSKTRLLLDGSHFKLVHFFFFSSPSVFGFYFGFSLEFDFRIVTDLRI